MRWEDYVRKLPELWNNPSTPTIILILDADALLRLTP